MPTETEDKNNKEYAVNYSRGRTGDFIRDSFNDWEDPDSIEFKAYRAGQEDRRKYGYSSETGDGSSDGPTTSDEPTSSGGSDSCCYIVGACLDDLGLPRNSLEMRAMKQLAKNHILKSFSGRRDYVRYGKIGPSIVTAIRARTNSQGTWEKVYETLQGIAPQIYEGKYQEGYQRYKTLVLDLESKFL
jgi:hypothetical protein